MANENKPLEELLLKHGRKPDSRLAAKRFAAFLERWDEIRAVYEKGWSYSDIWKTLRDEGLIDFSYASFTSYIRKMKKRKEKANTESQGSKQVPPLPERGTGRSVHNPGSTKVDLPTFGETVKRREDRRF